MAEIGDHYCIVVIGGDHYNTYGVVRSLGEEGIMTDVVILGRKENDSFVLRSRYVAHGYGCLTVDDALSVLDNYHGQCNIIICCSDEAENMVLNNIEKLSMHFILPVCENPKNTISLMDKSNIGSLAEQFGISIPKSWRVINRHIPDGISFPCITKPLSSIWGNKSDIVVCHDYEELSNVVTSEEHCNDYVVQQYIDYEKEISILGAVLGNGEVLLSGCIDKLRTCMIGTSSFAVMNDTSLLGDNIEKLKLMMQSTGYKGLFSAEFLKKGNAYYFLEVNFRNDGNTYVATASGNNLPLRYVQSLTESPTAISTSTHYPCHFMLEIEDFLAIRKNHVTIGQWVEDVKIVNCFLVYNKRDRKPFNKKIRLTLKSLFKAGLRKLGFYHY